MRPLIPVLGIILACSGCLSAAAQEPVYSQLTSQVAPDDLNCRDYTAQVTIDGLPQTIVGRACQQTDGTWRIAEGPPGQPTQFVTVYAPPYPSYPYYDHYPWLWGPPIGLSLGATVLFIDRDHRFHRFRFSHRHDDFRFSHRHDASRFGGLHPGVSPPPHG